MTLQLSSKKLALTVVGVILLVTALFALSAYITMLLVNLLADYFGFKTVTYGIACVINLLLGVVSGGVRFGRN